MTTQFLSTSQLNRLRALNLRAMPDSATILAPTVAPDGRGGFVTTFADSATVPCRFRHSTQRPDAVEGGQGTTQDLFVFLLPVDTVVDVGHRLRRNGVDYEVTSTPSDSSHQLSKMILAKKV